MSEDIPEGFERHTRRSPLTDPWEPLYTKRTDKAVIIGLRLAKPHTNGRGLIHGGLIAALADNAMGLSAVTVARQDRPDQRGAVTVGLTLDFIDSAQQGEWLEVHPLVLKCGGTLAFVECRVLCGARIIARGSASFRVS